MFIYKNEYLVNEDSDVSFVDVINKGNVYRVSFDTNMHDLVNKYHWRLSQKRNKFYAVTGQAKNGGHIISMHCLIFGSSYDAGYEIDHIDGNSLNNCASNLRLITRRQNIANVSVRIDNKTTGIRGISYSDKYNKYVVDFYIDGRRLYFKNFASINEAAYLRYLCEACFLGDFRCSSNDEYIFSLISSLDDSKRNEIEKYLIERLNKYAERHGSKVLTNTKNWHKVRREHDFPERKWYDEVV